MRDLKLEVCVDSVESALAAERGGADRVELCANLDAGGMTPSGGLILECKKRLTIGVHVMVRPRGGNFFYTQDEFAVMKRDVEFCKRAGVEGVVFGILRSNRTLDVARMRTLVERAHGLEITMHRTIDEIQRWKQAVDQLITLGVTRILTSGGARSVERGRIRIRAMAAYANGGIEVMPGGGVTFSNAGSLVAIPHINALHVLSAVSDKRSTSRSRHFPSTSFVVRSERVRRLAALIQTK